MDRLLFPLAAALAAGAAPVHAENVAAAAFAAEAEPIVIKGQSLKYGAKSTSTATRTETDVRDIPQALTTVTHRQIEDQQLRSMGQLLAYVPGASSGSGEGNRDQLVLRGNSSTADFFVDGLRDDVQYFRDFYNVDRVEVLKGPDAMIFGRGGGGGIVNRLLKRPTLASSANVSSSADNWGDVRLAADVDKRLSNILGLRLNAMIEDGTSFRDHVALHRYGINPTAAIVTSDTRIDVSYEHFHDRRTADRGVPADGHEPIRGFIHSFFGDPGISFSEADVDLVELGFEHDLGGGLTLRNHDLLGRYRKFYQNVYASRFSRASGLVFLSGYNNRSDRTNLLSQTDLVWENHLAGLDQTLLVGFEVGLERSRNMHLTATILGAATTPITDPTVERDVIFTLGAADTDDRVRATLASAYAEDQLRLTPSIEIVAGLRFDSLKIAAKDLHPNGGGTFERRDDLISPRIGLIAKPAQNLSLYASYSRSFLPQSGDQFSSLTAVTDGLKPERFDNYEVGAKWEVPGGLLVTAAAYELVRSNTRAIDPLDPSRTILTGRQRSLGLEFGLERSVTTRWLVSGGYAFQDAKITQTTLAAPAGRKVPLVPRSSVSLWNRYEVTKKLGIGLGLIARSRSFASISNAVKLPGYVRLDAALFTRLAHGLEASINAENLLGVHYFSAASNDNNIAPGSPRSVRATLGYRF